AIGRDQHAPSMLAIAVADLSFDLLAEIDREIGRVEDQREAAAQDFDVDGHQLLAASARSMIASHEASACSKSNWARMTLSPRRAPTSASARRRSRNAPSPANARIALRCTSTYASWRARPVCTSASSTPSLA